MTIYNAPVEEMMFLFNNLKDNKNYNEIEKFKEINEDQMYKLELDSFMKLIETQKTQERIFHTLKTGKPLIN